MTDDSIANESSAVLDEAGQEYGINNFRRLISESLALHLQI